VVGVESAGPSLQLLRRSAGEIAGASEKLRLVAGDAAEVLRACPGRSTRRCSILHAPAPPKRCVRWRGRGSRGSPT